MYMYTIDQPFSCRNSRGNINIRIYIWFLSKFISLHFSALWWRKWLELSPWHTRTHLHLSCKVISMAVDVLVKSVVRATAAIVLILTLEPIQFSARGGFNSWIGNIIDNSWRGSHIFVKIHILHWCGGVVILVGFPLLAALRGVILTPFGAASDRNLVEVTTFLFQCFAITLKMLDYCYYNLMRLWVYFCHSHFQSFATASRREATRSYPTRWRPKLGEKGKRWISKFCLNSITQILCHIKDYNIWNSYSLTDMWLIPQN